jgi:hypothetical protein
VATLGSTVDGRVDGDLLLDDRVDAVAGADGLALEQLLGGELAARADLLGPDRPPLVGEGDQVASGAWSAALGGAGHPLDVGQPARVGPLGDPDTGGGLVQQEGRAAVVGGGQDPAPQRALGPRPGAAAALEVPDGAHGRAGPAVEGDEPSGQPPGGDDRVRRHLVEVAADLDHRHRADGRPGRRGPGSWLELGADQADLVGAAGRADPQPGALAALGADQQPLHVGGADEPVAGRGGRAVLGTAAGGQQDEQGEGDEAWSHVGVVGSGPGPLKRGRGAWRDGGSGW